MCMDIMHKEFIRNRMISLRSTKNISARKLSQELGFSGDWLNQIENGRASPSLDGLLAFCQYFGITVGEFFDETRDYPISINDIVENLKKLNADELASVSDIVKRLADK